MYRSSINLNIFEIILVFCGSRFLFNIIIVQKYVCHEKGWVRSLRDSNQLKKAHTIQGRVRIVL